MFFSRCVKSHDNNTPNTRARDAQTRRGKYKFLDKICRILKIIRNIPFINMQIKINFCYTTLLSLPKLIK